MSILPIIGALLVSQSSASVHSNGAHRGGIGSGNLNSELRTQMYCLPRIDINASGSEVTVGQNMLFFKSANVAVSGITHIAQTSSIGAVAFPGKVTFDLYDASSNGTLACSSVHVWGFDQFGTPQQEEVVIADEDGTDQTTKVFERITKITATCTGGATGDLLLGYIGLEGVGLPRKVYGYGAVKGITWTDVTSATVSVTRTLLPSATSASDDTATHFLYSRLDKSHSAIDLTGNLDNSNSIAEGDEVCIYLRSPDGLQ